MLLIHPPVVKPAEPPAGIARLAGALRSNGVACHLWDANLEGFLSLMAAAETPGKPAESDDAWTRRARRHAEAHLSSLRQWPLYRQPALYQRTVRDVNRLLHAASPTAIRISLSDYRDADLSPLRSRDLARAAAEPERNPFFPFFSDRLTRLVETRNPGTVGFSLNYLSQALCTFAMIGHLRRRHPELEIVVGGSLVTSWATHLGNGSPLRALADDWIAGPGEGPLLARHGIPAGDGADWPPDYDDLTPAAYLSPGTVLPFSASRGCYWRRCSFCPEQAEKAPYRPLTAAQVRTQVADLRDRTQPALLHFLDNALSPALLGALADYPPKVPWYGFTRFTPELARTEFCRALRRSGCVMLQLGLESGDQGVLDSLDKGIDLATVSRCLTALRTAGIAAYVYLLFGVPTETPDAARRTLEFTVRHADRLGFLNLAIFNLPVQGPEAAPLETAPFYEGDLSLYRRFSHPRDWNRGNVRRFLEREFRRHPALTPILQRDPPFFTSNHAPFFVMTPFPSPSPNPFGKEPEP
ncbi:MAG: radical SAM protein [Syntrophales bacterium]|nr:radical SAM protein [Syntrophales bacterium]HQN25580.1 radical SAM protein [Syntrophales bacterium]